MSKHGLENLRGDQVLNKVTYTVMYPPDPGRGAHRAGITHMVDYGSGRVQCCGRFILELSHPRDRITLYPALVTCDGTP